MVCPSSRQRIATECMMQALERKKLLMFLQGSGPMIETNFIFFFKCFIYINTDIMHQLMSSLNPTQGDRHKTWAETIVYPTC